MTHPFLSLKPEQQARLFLVFLIASLGLAILMNTTGGPLKTEESPAGIVSFEFSWTVSGATAMLDDWNENAKIRAGFVQGLDYLFLLIYSQAFGLACLLAGQRLQRRGWPGGSWGPGLAWGMWLAALLDAIENLALVFLLFGWLADPWPLLAGICASAKFGLLGVGLAYSLTGWAAGGRNS
jgi:hypothetical protein